MPHSAPQNRTCLQCGYSLEHLAVCRCPECGREFNPMDPTTFAVRQPPSKGWLIATTVVWCYPVGFFLAPYFAWLLAWVTLGRQPRLGLDDPKSISVVIDVLHFLYVMMLIAFPLAIMAGFAANTWLAKVLNLRVSRMLLVYLGFILLWIGSIALARLDPGSIGVWFLD